MAYLLAVAGEGQACTAQDRWGPVPAAGACPLGEGTCHASRCGNCCPVICRAPSQRKNAGLDLVGALCEGRVDTCCGCWNSPSLPPVGLAGSVKVKDFLWSVTYRERYPVMLFCWDGALQTPSCFSYKTSFCVPHSRHGQC